MISSCSSLLFSLLSFLSTSAYSASLFNLLCLSPTFLFPSPSFAAYSRSSFPSLLYQRCLSSASISYFLLRSPFLISQLPNLTFALPCPYFTFLFINFSHSWSFLVLLLSHLFIYLRFCLFNITFSSSLPFLFVSSFSLSQSWFIPDSSFPSPSLSYLTFHHLYFYHFRLFNVNFPLPWLSPTALSLFLLSGTVLTFFLVFFFTTSPSSPALLRCPPFLFLSLSCSVLLPLFLLFIYFPSLLCLLLLLLSLSLPVLLTSFFTCSIVPHFYFFLSYFFHSHCSLLPLVSLCLLHGIISSSILSSLISSAFATVLLISSSSFQSLPS